jgi:hypothetical protein
MPAKAAQPKKAAKEGAGGSSGGKAKKKKWSKGKVRDKLNNMVRQLFYLDKTEQKTKFRFCLIKQLTTNVSKICLNIN